MKKSILFIGIIFLLFSCSEEQICFDSPEPPYGKPDKEEHLNMVGVQTEKYIYECYKGDYIEITWTKYNGFCWEESSFISEPCKF